MGDWRRARHAVGGEGRINEAAAGDVDSRSVWMSKGIPAAAGRNGLDTDGVLDIEDGSGPYLGGREPWKNTRI